MFNESFKIKTIEIEDVELDYLKGMDIIEEKLIFSHDIHVL